MYPVDAPSTFTWNCSPLSRRLAPVFAIADTTVSYLFSTLLAIDTRDIPNSRLTADEANTGSFASIVIMPSSVAIFWKGWFCILRIFLTFEIRMFSLFLAKADGNITTKAVSLIFFSSCGLFIISMFAQGCK